MNMYTRNDPIIDKVSSNLYLVDINEKSFELGRWPYGHKRGSIWKAYEVTEDEVRFIETFTNMRDAMRVMKAMS
jgi:hypothetical protein